MAFLMFDCVEPGTTTLSPEKRWVNVREIESIGSRNNQTSVLWMRSGGTVLVNGNPETILDFIRSSTEI